MLLAQGESPSPRQGKLLKSGFMYLNSFCRMSTFEQLLPYVYRRTCNQFGSPQHVGVHRLSGQCACTHLPKWLFQVFVNHEICDAMSAVAAKRMLLLAAAACRCTPTHDMCHMLDSNSSRVTRAWIIMLEAGVLLMTLDKHLLCYAT